MKIRVVVAVAIGVIAAWWSGWVGGGSSPLGTHHAPPGHAAAFELVNITMGIGAFLNPASALNLVPAGSTPVAELFEVKNAVLFFVDFSLELLVFVEVSDLATLWEEPFLDHGILKLAGKRAWSLSLTEAERWADSQVVPPTVWVFNTGRSGSTLMHRMLVKAGVASVSEAFWMDQLALGRGKEPDQTIERFLRVCHITDAHVASRLAPGRKVVSMNTKSFGYKLLDLVEKMHPRPKVMYMYRAVDEVVQSFYAKVVASQIPGIVRTLLSVEILTPVWRLLKNFLMPSGFRSAEIRSIAASSWAFPGTNNVFADMFSEGVFDGLAYWLETASSQRDSLVLRFKEWTTKDERKRRSIVKSVLAWAFGEAPSDATVDQALQAFLKDSQEGSHMGKTEGEVMKLPDHIMEQVRFAALKVPSMRRSDFLIPGSLGAELSA